MNPEATPTTPPEVPPANIARQALWAEPTGDRVIVIRDESPSTTKTGLILPGAAKETPMTGTVIAVAPKATYKKGDRVIFGKFAGDAIVIAGRPALLMSSLEVKAVITHESEA